MTVEELNIVISAQNREFNAAIDSVIGRLDDLEEQSKRTADNVEGIFGKVVKTAAGLGIGKAIGDSIMSGGELEQQLGGVEVVFREHAESLKNTASTAYKDMGLSESAYLASANKMGALFKGSGFNVAYAADMSQKAMQRAADVASIMGVDISSAMEAVTGAAKGNFTMMDNLGVAMNDTTLQAYAQEKGLGKLETTQQKVNAAMQMFLDKTEYAAGNYARENDTFSGSLTTAKAQLENLAADLGTQLLPTATSIVAIVREGLELISPMVISLGEGINSAAEYLINMSPSAKTMLALAVGAAVAIPAVTKAQLMYNAANAAWKGLVSVLIPKQLTWNSALKATFGWLAIIAGVLALVASVGATRREMESDSLDDTANSADNASESLDGLSESYDDVAKSAQSTEKKLADIDTLNIFKGSSSSTGGIDFGAITTGASEASDAIEEAKKQIGDLEGQSNGIDLSGLSDTFSTTFSDIGSGFSTIFDAFNFDSDTQLSSLRVLDKKIRGLFGDDWSDFWTKVGSTMYRAFGENNSEYDRYMALTDIQNWLEGVNHFLTGWMGEFGEAWTEFWKGVGSDIYQWLNPEVFDEQGEGVTKEYVSRDGRNDKLGTGRRFDGAGDERSSENGGAGGRIRDYTYPDYTIPQSALSTIAPGLTGSARALSPAETKEQIINTHITVELDGNVLGESVTSYQEREAMRSNGY